MRAKRLVSFAARSLEVEEFDLPDSPGPGQVLARAECTLVSSGTEIANYLGITTQRASVGDDWRRRPYYPGYSFVGRVLAVGDGVNSLAVGDRISCQAPHVSLAIVDAERAVRVPDRLSSKEAAWGSLVAIVLNAIRLAPIQLGDSVAVVGLGPIGQLAAQLARLAGGRPVVGFDPIERRRAVALECGARAALECLVREGGARETFPGGFEFVFEATGSPSAFTPALGLVATGGRLVLLGSTRGLVEAFDPYRDIHLKGVTVAGAHASTAPAQASRRERWTEPANRRLGLELIAEGSLWVEPLTSHEMPASAAPEVFAGLASDRRSYLGVALTWR